MKSLVIGMILFLFGQIQTAKAQIHHIYKDEKSRVIRLADSIEVVLTKSPKFNIDSLRLSPQSKFVGRDDATIPALPFSSWMHFKLSNETNKSRNELFRFFTYVDSICIYEIKNQEVVDTMFAGMHVNPRDKSLPAIMNNISFNLGAGESKEYIIRQYFTKKPSNYMLNGIFIIPAKPEILHLIKEYSWHCFYAGVMFLLSLVSIFMAFIFKERIFIYFSLMTFFFGCYFPTMSGVAEAIVMHQLRNYYISIGQVTVSGLLLSAFLFINRYISIDKRFPVFHKILFVVTIIVMLFSHIIDLLFDDTFLLYNFHNVLIILWIIMLMVPAFILAIKKDKAARNLLISILVLVLGAIVHILNLSNLIPDYSWTEQSFQWGTILFSGILFSGVFSKISHFKTEKSLNEKLIFNILPKEIAIELKEEGKSAARKYEKVSVLFTDFKGFTQISEQLGAEELVFEINICFEAFDHIMEKYEVEKIKTIGDAYMAAAGLTGDIQNATVRLIKAALEMQSFVHHRAQNQIEKNKVSFRMRAGVHSGPVVAGIAGFKKYQYDLWGDTVNTASRMESNCEPGMVNISHSCYELIKDEPSFEFESRPLVDIKGKGKMPMYYIRSKQSSQ